MLRIGKNGFAPILVNTAYFIRFVIERHNVYLRRQSGLDRPWTEDEILQNYRFCNIYRELDRETMWIRDNWRAPNQDDPNLWFAMLVARVVNWSPTLDELGYPVPWKRGHFLRVLSKRNQEGGKVWTGAYMITTHKQPMSKIAYYGRKVLDPAWDARDELRPRKGDTLNAFHERLMTIHGISSFLAAQVVADMKYAGPLRNAADWHDWAAPGAGSLRGMNRVLGRDIKSRYESGEWLDALSRLREETNRVLEGKFGWLKLHAQDIQNCLCEFDKYERVRLNEGRPRSRFNGHTNTTQEVSK